MPVPAELLVIMLLLATAVVYGYFYLKRAQARTAGKEPSTVRGSASEVEEREAMRADASAAVPPSSPEADVPGAMSRPTQMGAPLPPTTTSPPESPAESVAPEPATFTAPLAAETPAPTSSETPGEESPGS
jgi:hypothetical protein